MIRLYNMFPKHSPNCIPKNTQYTAIENIVTKQQRSIKSSYSSLCFPCIWGNIFIYGPTIFFRNHSFFRVENLFSMRF